MAPKPKVTSFSFNKRYRFSDRSESVTTALEVIDFGIQVLPNSIMRPILLNLWYGPISDPTDQFLDVYIADVDPNNLPDQASLEERFIWAARQVWRTVGTPATVVQTMIHENTLLFGVPQVSNLALETRLNDYRICLLAIADQALTYAFVGHMDVEVTIFQKKWLGAYSPEGISPEELYG